jgi:hypothetical protein
MQKCNYGHKKYKKLENIFYNWNIYIFIFLIKLYIIIYK